MPKFRLKQEKQIPQTGHYFLSLPYQNYPYFARKKALFNSLDIAKDLRYIN